MEVLDYYEVVFSLAGNTREGDLPVEMELSMYKFVLACSKTVRCCLSDDCWDSHLNVRVLSMEQFLLKKEDVCGVDLFCLWSFDWCGNFKNSVADLTEPNIKFYIMAHSLYVRGHVSLWCSICDSWQERPVTDSFYLWVVVDRRGGMVCLMLWSHLSPVALKGSGKEITWLLCPCYGSFIWPRGQW